VFFGMGRAISGMIGFGVKKRGWLFFGCLV